MSEQITCPKCKKTFYLDGYRLRNAKTTSCYYCGYRIIKAKLVKQPQGENER